MAVATRMGVCPVRKRRSASSRSRCVRSPWIDVTGYPSLSKYSSSWSAPDATNKTLQPASSLIQETVCCLFCYSQIFHLPNCFFSHLTIFSETKKISVHCVDRLCTEKCRFKEKCELGYEIVEEKTHLRIFRRKERNRLNQVFPGCHHYIV